MNKLVHIITLLLVQSLLLMVRADDCSSVRYEDWTYGLIKSSTPNEQIALDKELMIVTHDSIKAIFVFTNTTAENVVTPCAFPFNVRLPLNEGHDDSGRTDSILVISEAYNSRNNHLLWSMALDKKITPTQNRSYEDFAVDKASVAAANKRLRKYTFNDYKDHILALTDYEYLLSCCIQQNGQDVPIENVGIETSVSEKDGLLMDVYFYHHLKFKPNEQIKVVVTYPIGSLQYKDPNGNHYRIKYDISSGGTWKGGNIKSFMLCSDLLMDSHAESPVNRKMDSCSFGGRILYYKQNYRPQQNDYFIFYDDDSLEESYRQTCDKNAILKRYLEQDSFLILNASNIPDSERKDYALFPDEKKPLSFVKDVKSSTSQDVKQLFDGNLYTSYVTQTPSWIEFTLTRAAYGPFVSNGNISSSLNELLFKSNPDSFPVFNDTAWENTARVKTMTIMNKDTRTLHQLFLADKYGLGPLFAVNDWNGVNAVLYPVFLAPGRYRLTFGDTYKGIKSGNVGLSEIWFKPYPKNLVAMVNAEQKDSIQIFQGCYKLIIGKGSRALNDDLLPSNLLRSPYSRLYKETLKAYGTEVKGAQGDSIRTKTARHKQAVIRENSNLSFLLLISVAVLALVVGGALIYSRRRNQQSKNE
ncbi:MAG: DUF4424 domain-containing protein [Paludibacteraceae bacterium]|nr:DUF4424 domain-containing protein [Paludibacteraceae bacterium]